MELNVLKQFRKSRAPKDIVKVDNKPISTLKREELIDLAGKSGVDVLDLCVIGGIEDSHDNMVALVHYILTTTVLADKDSGKRQPERDVEPSAKKARKGNEGPMEDLRQEVSELRKQLEGRQKETIQDNFERARQEAKAEAGKREVNVDVLFQKLIILEEAARKAEQKDAEKYSILLNRYHVHKEKPSFVGAFVLSSLCTKAEESILQNEHRLLKSSTTANPYSSGGSSALMGGSGMMGGGGPPSGHFMGPTSSPFFTGGMGAMDMSKPRFMRPPVKTCYNCGSPWHLSFRCPEPRKK